MRFFKSFKLLHRRTKSDPINAILSDFSRHDHSSSISNGISGPFWTALACSVPDSAINPSTHLNLRILDLETENSSLRVASAASLNELTELRFQLKATQAELYAELHRGMRRRTEDRNEIERLREKLAQYETFLELVNADPNGGFLADAHVSLRNGHTLDQDPSNAVKRIYTTSTDAAGHVLSVLGLRTQDEYVSALQLTLNSRMQLRQSKKIAKFWKNTATEDGKNSHIVTPSPSAISSICEALPVERQKAVDDLIARRKSNPRHSSTPVRTPLRHGTLASSVPPVDSGRTALDHLPSNSRSSLSPLSPLASQSERQELDKISSKNRMSRWPSGLGRKPLGQIDLNPRNTALIAPSHPITPRKKIQTISSSVSDPFAPAHSESEPFVNVSTNELSIGSSPRGLVDSARHSLANITEENESRCESNSPNDVSQEWVTCDRHKDDTSFGSNAETLIHASPITSPKKRALSKAETMKSRLPIPVFRSLKRLSSTKLATVIGKAVPPSLQPKAKVPTRSPTRLPVRASRKSR